MSDPLRRVTGLSIRDFVASNWGVAPLFRTAAQLSESDLTDLLSRDAIDELLSQRGLRTPFVRMTHNGDIIPPHRYTRSGGAGAEISDQVADDKVLAEFAAGATLVLQGLHRMWPPIQKFASEFSAQLGHPVQVNAYVTPPMSAGLAPHYDVHDVFVVQFAGRKQWRIHQPVLMSPLRNQPWNERKSAVAERCNETPLFDTVLECGDTMYLPRGFIHGATSLGDVSGHLTIGVHPLTRQTLADHVFAAFAGDVELRQSLPAGYDLSDQTMLDGELTATIAILRAALDRVDRAEIARGIGRHLAAATRPAPLRPLEQLFVAATLTPQTHVRLRPGLRVMLRTEGHDLLIELPDKTIRYPETMWEAIRSAISGNAVSADTLSSTDAIDGLTLLSQLLRDGIVIPV